MTADRAKVDRKRSGGAVVGVAAVLITGIFSTLLVAGAMFSAAVISVLGGGANGCDTTIGFGATNSNLVNADIPPTAMTAYQQAGAATGIDWTYLAAIGKVESSHGSYGGAALQSDGSVTPRIIGPPLDGTAGNRAIRDTDGGVLDGDTTWDRAVGPMQFIPTTWATQGKDGNFDGVNDPHNLFDAILAAAFYLKSAGAPGDMRRALFSYNQADWYVRKVMAQAEEYRSTSTTDGAIPRAAGGELEEPSNSATPLAPTVATTDWVQPLTEGTFTLTSRFGLRANPTGSGEQNHNGLDYGAPSGTPIVAIGAGTVLRSEFSSSYGNVVYLDHGSGNVSIYAHMYQRPLVRAGQEVTAGQQLGGVGTTGNSTGNHLHLQIEVNGNAVNPETFLAAAGVAGAGGTAQGAVCESVDLTGQTGPVGGDGTTPTWGGHQNGRIPAAALCAVDFAPQHRLRCDASSAFTQLNDVFTLRFGRSIQITDSYRDYPEQVSCRARKGTLCADPGTSNHGWGMALDLGSNINTFGTPEHQWMVANADRFGWVLPSWAQQSGSNPEPWHWQFGSFQ